MRQSLVVVMIGLCGAVLVAQQTRLPAGNCALTVDSIVQGATLVRHPPSNLPWSRFEEPHFEWRTASDDEAATGPGGRGAASSRKPAGPPQQAHRETVRSASEKWRQSWKAH